ncbi:FeoC-like transcriptional regulator [Oryzibacter oryziterrae]|uniref:FeoC-like transcriptional regulator n=1 Tax=Oryzibacter oryziterrae TaxID=2766474 RepID=UPI001F164936|nr:FeoC-like transcriptional regulator [Oryzibacter oryziterrae]
MLTMTGLRDFLRERRNASLTEMSIHFDAAPDAVRGVLGQWTAKGRVRQLVSGESCCRAGSGCGGGCRADEIYAWLDPN